MEVLGGEARAADQAALYPREGHVREDGGVYVPVELVGGLGVLLGGEGLVAPVQSVMLKTVAKEEASSL